MFLVCQNLYLYHQDGGAETGVLLQRDDEVWWVQVKDGQVSKIQVKYNYKYKTNTNFFLAIVVCTAAVAIDNICLCVNTNTHRQILSIATAAVQTTIMCKKNWAESYVLIQETHSRFSPPDIWAHWGYH